MIRPALLCLLCLCSPAHAQEAGAPKEADPKQPAPKGREVQLVYRFQELDGLVATYRIQTVLRQKKRVVGSTKLEDTKKGTEKGSGEAVATTRQTYELAFSVGKRGLGIVRITPRRIEAELEENGKVRYRFDSKAGTTPPKAIKDMTERLNKTAVLEVTRRGEVKAVRGVRVSQRKAYKSNFHRLPSRALTMGRGWEQKDKQPMPPFGNLHYFTSFRLKSVKPGPEGKGERYRVNAKLLITYEGISPTESSRMELTKQGGSGHLVFDNRGLLIEEKLKSKVEIAIKAVAGREVHEVETETVRWLSGIKKKSAK